MHTPVTKTELFLVEFNMKTDTNLEGVHPADFHSTDWDDEGILIVNIKCSMDEITSMTDKELCDSVGLDSEDLLWTNREDLVE